MSRKPRYVLITPAHNEEKYIGEMIDSILAQDILPCRWLIVNDGSADRTAEIVESYATKHYFIELQSASPRCRRLSGGEEAVESVLKMLNVCDYDFVARFDADLKLERGYIASILGEFDRDGRLGIAGGGLYIEKDGAWELEKGPQYHVRGALKMYRSECLIDIGGLESRIGWDITDEVRAWTKGWKTKSFFHYRVIHRRPTGNGLPARMVYWERGRADYLTWSHPLFALGKAIKTAIETRSLVKAGNFLGGFISCYLRREKRLKDLDFTSVRRSQQLRRIALFFSSKKSENAWLMPGHGGESRGNGEK